MITLRSLTSLCAASALTLALVACGGDESTEAPDAPAEAEATAEEEPATPDTPDLSAEDLAAGSDNVALVPSPVETQKALESAGIDTKLSALIPEHKFDLEKADADHAALRTGVVLADALLTVKSAEQDVLLTRLDAIRTGMGQLGGGADIDSTLRDMQERIKAEAVSRDELLKEFDELSGAVIPELEFNGNDRIVPLIEAGSWLEGSNLVARAVADAHKPGAADTLLKQPAVVDYFIKYVKTEGAEKAPAAVTAKLEESLNTLKGLASKETELTEEDIATVAKVTNEVLALL